MAFADVLARTVAWFVAAVPVPTPKNFTTQLGVHFEEVREMIAELTPRDMDTHNLLLDANIALQKLSDYLKQSPVSVVVTETNRVRYLDAICDQMVTGAGCAHMSQMDVVGALAEVNRSNFSKFNINGNPIFNENMKVMKGPNYTEPDLTPFV